MGVKADGKTAVFLISADAVPNGDGVCRPSADACDTLELKVGDTEFLDVQTAAGGVVQYQLSLTSIAKQPQKTAAKAAAARVQENSAGRALLREAVASNAALMQGWSFSRELGVLTFRAVAGASQAPARAEAVAGGLGAAASVTAPTPAP
jgi:hypothetical protein